MKSMLSAALTIGAALVVLAVHAASAQSTTTSVYGRNGEFVGSTMMVGRNTSFYNGRGRFEGSAIRSGNSTTLYDRNGHYQGQVFTRPSSGSR